MISYCTPLQISVTTSPAILPLPGSTISKSSGRNTVDIVLRTEELDIVERGRGKFAGEVVSVIFKGVHYEIMVRTENQDYKIHTTDLTEVGKKVDLDFWPEDIHVMEPMGTY